MKKKGAVIKGVKIYDVFDLWKRKPKQLAFNDTNVIVVTAEAGKETIKETFFTCLKPDGTFNIKTPNRISQARREKLAKFLKYYFEVKYPEEYNLKENVKKWIGKKIQIERDFIFIP